ncbi:carbamoyl phosphate synthase small subunit [Candidatus Nomurabacteria bacterium RIFCSPLOWO2_12_FULL_46_14]|uniref:Carbamoyl phosphate synthase small chain n=1 Tax=Candidatus Nomurabacteria bacterium RIFCSPLOWO2_12_FULL_46_14 TaxID=1801797 RepID=A0A1F6YD34_9BACT|nr:MAG: carbamoyl phosphate synthase small subunit [Candidatus Giovannonibacteria bacterium RIFCSPHIGHO2_02_FULL_43_32]OGJ04274.1 MAG: carbamoyl phosphate synthase small subunit [Candidatus Nomurabacteria bacterium RIFCSPLOWO2_12_FULL_46_14]
MKDKKIKLMLKDGSEYEALSFGADKSVAGEVVFATGMAGYPEALTDPSFAGQILVLTYPLIGNYGVPAEAELESKKVQVAGLIVANYIDTPSHHTSKMTLGAWLRQSGVPLLEVKDTREITQKLREQGVMLGKIVFGRENIPFYNPNRANLVAQVSAKKIQMYGTAGPTVILIDCGAKLNIVRRLAARGLRVAVVPWDTDVTRLPFPFLAVIISNGPGDPKKAAATIRNVKKIIAKKIPTLGICLGNQILALAQGGTTYKLKFGHRSQNQPAVESKSGRGFLTTQNHGFAVKKIPKGFREWFYNANDHTNEGIIHETLPLMSVQFHPESSPGPMDTDWIFDYFFKCAGIPPPSLPLHRGRSKEGVKIL